MRRKANEVRGGATVTESIEVANEVNGRAEGGDG